MREYSPQVRHLELDAKEIFRRNNSWEAFVIEDNRPEPRVVATLSAYGTQELVHSLQFVMQWPDERVEYTRSFHLLDGDLDRLTDEVYEELTTISHRTRLTVNEGIYRHDIQRHYKTLFPETMLTRPSSVHFKFLPMCKIVGNTRVNIAEALHDYISSFRPFFRPNYF